MPRLQPKPVDQHSVDDAAKALKSGEPCVILMNGILTDTRLALADKVAQATGARVITDTFVSRMHRGAGRAEALRLPYFGEQAADVLSGTKHLILVGTNHQ